MKNIVFTRIDERLIHGQVITSWIKVNDINTIVVVDDATATNTFAKRILFAAAPKSITLKVFKLNEAIEYLLGEHEEEKIMLMTKVPHPILELLNAGVEIKEVNLGNMGGAAGRKRFNLNVNDKGLVHFSYERYLENKIRENFDFEGTPIVLQFKNKGEE